MENRVFGNFSKEGLEVVEREGRYFVRYDAGAHVSAFREDEISLQEFAQLRRGNSEEYQVIIRLQRRLELAGINPYKQNWSPSGS